jgi:hypothetical protein
VSLPEFKLGTSKIQVRRDTALATLLHFWNVTLCNLIGIDTNVFRNLQPPTFRQIFYAENSRFLKNAAIYQTPWHHIPKDCNPILRVDDRSLL